MSEQEERDYSDEMHRQNDPHYIKDSSFINTSDWDNDATDDPSFWEDEDEYWDDGDQIDACPWCQSTVCGYLDNDGQLTCCVTKRMIP